MVFGFGGYVKNTLRCKTALIKCDASKPGTRVCLSGLCTHSARAVSISEVMKAK